MINFKKNTEYYLLVSCLLTAFMSLSVTVINPIYFLGFIVIVLSLIYLDLKSLDKLVLIFFLYFLVSLVGFVFGIYFFHLEVRDGYVFLSSILFLYCILVGSSTIIFGSKVNPNLRIEVYNKIYNFIIIFMAIDLFSRILMAANNGNFYDYKWGIFYFDSNFTGTIILLFLTFSIYLKQDKILDIGFLRNLFLVILLIGTFSRAAIFSYFLTFFLFRYTRKFIGFLALIFGLFAIFILNKFILIYLGGGNFSNIDPSFNSKFYLISIAIDNYNSISLMNKFFGIGLANFRFISDGLFAHNIFITFFYEFGFFGILSFLIFLICCYFKIGKDILYIYIPFFIVSFSLFSAYMPFFFILIACMYLEKKY